MSWAYCLYKLYVRSAERNEAGGEGTYCAKSFNLEACRQLFPSLPELKGTKTPMANIFALRSDSSAGRLTNALIPAYCSWTKYLSMG